MGLLQRPPFPSYDLTFQDVLDILKLIDASPFEELEVEIEDLKLKVSRRAGAAAGTEPGDRSGPAAAAQPAGGKTEAASRAPGGGRVETPPEPPAVPAAKREAPAPDLAGRVAVRPPMAGTFYSAPAPGAAAFVQVGSTVAAGDRVGIVEVMKLFTPVLSPCGGTIREILVANEEFVQGDQVLMLIEPAE